MNEPRNIDSLIKEAVFGPEEVKNKSRRIIRAMAAAAGIYPASIQELYEASGKGLYHGITVPAINIRGIAYDVARAAFRAILKNNVRACIFELARSEMGYTRQTPDEYAVAVLAAAVKEGYRGPVFIQADHTQVRRKMYREDAAGEIGDIKRLVKDAVEAGFYNIDIDASTIVDLEKPTLAGQQDKNSSVTADLTRFIRGIEPAGVTVSVGGEIGEIGKGNSTVADLQAFMDTYHRYLGEGVKGISKISVQTGTSHGGVVLPDGSLASVKIDFDTLKKMSRVARESYGMGGAVQHGASTLPDEAFDKFPEVETLEVHLATGFQNIILDSPHFPPDLRAAINQHLAATYAGERKDGETEEQFLYKTRKKAFGDFKQELWDLPEAVNRGIMRELEDRFTLMFGKLNVINTRELVEKHVTAAP